jgi:hypothetical protein
VEEMDLQISQLLYSQFQPTHFSPLYVPTASTGSKIENNKGMQRVVLKNHSLKSH